MLLAHLLASMLPLAVVAVAAAAGVVALTE